MSVTISKLTDTFLLPDAQDILSTIDELVGKTPSPFTPDNLESLITLCNKSQNILTQTLVKAFFEFIRDKTPNITVSRDPLLLWACDMNMPTMALALLKAGANPDVADVNGDTPILITITKLQKQELSPDIIKKYQELLKELSKTADTTVVNNLGIMILQNKEGSTPENDKRIGDRPGNMKHSVFSGDFFVWYPSSTLTGYNSVYKPPVVTKTLADLPEIIQSKKDIYKDSNPLANAYYIAGHGGPGKDTFTVPKDCIIVVKAKEGMFTVEDDRNLLKICELSIEQLKNPLKYQEELYKAFLSLAIYKEGDKCPNFTYNVRSCYPSKSAYTECEAFGSGVIDLTKLKGGSCRSDITKLSDLKLNNDTSIGEYVEKLFIHSIFPTKQQVEQKIFTTSGFFYKTKTVKPAILSSNSSIPQSNTIPYKINKILNELDDIVITTQKTLCELYPGVYYNFVCRSTKQTTAILEKLAKYDYKTKLTELFTTDDDNDYLTAEEQTLPISNQKSKASEKQLKHIKAIQQSQIGEAEMRRKELVMLGTTPYNASKESKYLRQKTFSEDDILNIFNVSTVEMLVLKLTDKKFSKLESNGFRILNKSGIFYIYSPYDTISIGYVNTNINKIIIHPPYSSLEIGDIVEILDDYNKNIRYMYVTEPSKKGEGLDSYNYVFNITKYALDRPVVDYQKWDSRTKSIADEFTLTSMTLSYKEQKVYSIIKSKLNETPTYFDIDKNTKRSGDDRLLKLLGDKMPTTSALSTPVRVWISKNPSLTKIGVWKPPATGGRRLRLKRAAE